MDEPIISIGLLTDSDLRKLGDQFQRHYPVNKDDDIFADLIAALDRLPTIKPQKSSSRKTFK